MHGHFKMKRRKFVQNSILASTALTGTLISCSNSASNNKSNESVSKGNIKQSVSRWCYGDFELDELLPALKEIGIHAIDLVGEEDWPTLKKHDIHCSMCNGAEINLIDGWNDPKFHDQLISNYANLIPKVADAGYTNLILFSGNRRGMDDKQGLINCVAGLKKILPLAEKYGVVLQMELFNSKVDHPDYMCDNTPWGIALCKELGSENFKLLYDIYHMQINEGDIIRTINDYHPYFGHYHTAGVPGRHEINDKQELYYPAIMHAIVDTGFTGFVAHEFTPTYEDKLSSLREAFGVCDV